MNVYGADYSDDDSRKSTVEPSTPEKGRRRSTRACDHCRRTKSKCERVKSGLGQQSCRGCAALGLTCTFSEPAHKRGPPKGYILTLERRLHQVEALLGTIISSDDPRARSLVQDLSRDKLANHIINKVRVGPFGPVGRTNHPFSTTKEDFLASITGDPGDSSSEQSGNSLDSQNDLAFMSPSNDWQDRLKGVLSSARAEASASAALMASPPPDVKLRRATYPSADSPHTPVPYFLPTYHSPPPPAPQASGSYLYQYHTYAQNSAVRDTANQPDPPQVSAPMPVMCNIYTDVDGQFRTHESMAQGVDHGYRGTQSGFPGTMSEHATQNQYYNSFRR